MDQALCLRRVLRRVQVSLKQRFEDIGTHLYLHKYGDHQSNDLLQLGPSHSSNHERQVATRHINFSPPYWKIKVAKIFSRKDSVETHIVVSDTLKKWYDRTQLNDTWVCKRKISLLMNSVNTLWKKTFMTYSTNSDQGMCTGIVYRNQAIAIPRRICQNLRDKERWTYIKHVIQKWDACATLTHSSPIQIYTDVHFGLLCLSYNLSNSCCKESKLVTLCRTMIAISALSNKKEGVFSVVPEIRFWVTPTLDWERSIMFGHHDHTDF